MYSMARKSVHNRNDTVITFRAPAWVAKNWKMAAEILGDPERGGVVGMTFSRFMREAATDAAEAVFDEWPPDEDDLGGVRDVEADDEGDG